MAVAMAVAMAIAAITCSVTTTAGAGPPQRLDGAPVAQAAMRAAGGVDLRHAREKRCRILARLRVGRRHVQRRPDRGHALRAAGSTPAQGLN